jgi:hypothetical protein
MSLRQANDQGRFAADATMHPTLLGTMIAPLPVPASRESESEAAEAPGVITNSATVWQLLAPIPVLYRNWATTETFSIIPRHTASRGNTVGLVNNKVTARALGTAVPWANLMKINGTALGVRQLPCRLALHPCPPRVPQISRRHRWTSP